MPFYIFATANFNTVPSADVYTKWYITGGVMQLDSIENIDYYDDYSVKEYYDDYSVKTWETYEYDNVNNYQQVKSTKKTSDGKTMITNIYYPHDYTELTSLQENNIIVPIKKETEIDGVLISGSVIEYNDAGQPVSISQYENDEESANTPHDEDVIVPDSYELKKEIEYSIGKPVHTIKNEDENTCYIWGYNKQYPIAKIENATYEEVTSAIDTSQINTLSNNDNDNGSRGSGTNEDALRVALDALYEIDGAIVNTFTYDPLIGMTSQTDPKGRTTYYEYDDFGRLEYIKDQDQNIVKQYNYHYASEEIEE
jgi:YD repeat-containing protein